MCTYTKSFQILIEEEEPGFSRSAILSGTPTSPLAFCLGSNHLNKIAISLVISHLHIYQPSVYAPVLTAMNVGGDTDQSREIPRSQNNKKIFFSFRLDNGVDSVCSNIATPSKSFYDKTIHPWRRRRLPDPYNRKAPTHSLSLSPFV